MPFKPLKYIIVLLLGIFDFSPATVFAGDWRFGVSLGYGGAGLTEAATVNGAAKLVERSEGPGVFSIFADRLIADRRSLGFEHSRGFRLGPFSTGVSFTGLTHRWYFLGPAPAPALPEPGTTTLLVRRFAPFVGLNAGFALADISRATDTVQNITGSGVYAGFRAGADYPLALGRGLRPEIVYNTTFMQSPAEPASLTELSIQCALYFYL